ncbi:DUF485 domain-containing protein [Leucobacter luti]|uniref:Uncharacterized membrane protein (DUF485 family) n=1 Tax=Leucobacter luti TaxID=340320 RepID=A0A4Q7TXJ1_9MICO|nr:DUF485 domain-containing protein [Leucobacter luti]MBL3698576.1 DUF485 domain-containing protein [Leucobacter luti]RZT65951.1 uncharacterized membrane protein (DUF485 family) [Leucobacter luti]
MVHNTPPITPPDSPPGPARAGGNPGDVEVDYVDFQARPEFQELRHRFRRFVFPVTVAFMIWFLGYVLLAAFNHEFMARPLLGLNVGLWLGLAQFVTTFGITMWYVRFANRRLDPVTEGLRAELEDIAAGAAPNQAHETEAGTK